MSEAKQPFVIVFPRGQLLPRDKERLTKAGVIAVEADNPNLVCQLHLTAPMVTTKLSGDAIVSAALTALSSQPASNSVGSQTHAGAAMAHFVSLLARSFNEPAPSLEK